MRKLQTPTVYAAGRMVYVTHDVPAPHGRAISQIMRIDARTGRVLATAQLGSQFDQALLAGSELWVVSDGVSGRRPVNWLWRLDPRSLVVRSRRRLGRGAPLAPAGSLSEAGGLVWVATATLSAFSADTGRLVRTVARLPAAGGQVVPDPTGRTLVASLGDGHVAHVARLDPRTGATEAVSASVPSVTRPFIGGVLDGGVWISYSSGMAGSVERLDPVTLRPTRTAGPDGMPTGGVRVDVIDGILWVSDPGDRAFNYCANPRTGRRQAALASVGNGEFFTASSSYVYYSPEDTNPVQLVRAAIPRPCRI